MARQSGLATGDIERIGSGGASVRRCCLPARGAPAPLLPPTTPVRASMRGCGSPDQQARTVFKYRNPTVSVQSSGRPRFGSAEDLSGARLRGSPGLALRPFRAQRLVRVCPFAAPRRLGASRSAFPGCGAAPPRLRGFLAAPDPKPTEPLLNTGRNAAPKVRFPSRPPCEYARGQNPGNPPRLS